MPYWSVWVWMLHNLHVLLPLLRSRENLFHTLQTYSRFPTWSRRPRRRRASSTGRFLMLSFWPERRRKWYGWNMWREKCIIILNKSINMYIYFYLCLYHIHKCLHLEPGAKPAFAELCEVATVWPSRNCYIVRYCFKILKLKWTIGSCLEDCNIIY